MARTVNPKEYAAKRSEILDAAQSLIYTKGYERMTIQDMLTALDMSSGAFYHYFPTKPAVLEALIERMQEEAEEALLTIVQDRHLPALEKLQRFFASLEGASLSQKAFVADLMRVWLSDDNAIVREKVYAAMNERRAPLLTAIVRQGIREGVFTTTYPEPAGEIMLSLARGMGTTLTRLLLAYERGRNEEFVIDQIVTTYGAYSDALERILGAPTGSLHRLDTEAARMWVAALRGG